jgi:hypothetical protein
MKTAAPKTSPGMPEVEQPLQRTWLDRLREWTGQDLSCCPRCQGPLTRQPLEAPPTVPVPMPLSLAALCEVDSS